MSVIAVLFERWSDGALVELNMSTEIASVYVPSAGRKRGHLEPLPAANVLPELLGHPDAWVKIGSYPVDPPLAVAMDE